MYVLLYLTSPLIADFFEREELSSLIRACGLILFANALSITQTTILTRNIDFRTKTKGSLISSLVSGVVGIIMAYLGFGVWALVGQLLSRQFLYSVCFWVLNKWWPKLIFSIDSFKYMWGFGWKLLVSGLLNNIWSQLYQVVVGKFYTPVTLGQYSKAKEYANIFSTTITSIIQRVGFPMLSQIQDDEVRMVQVYRRVIKMTMFLTCMCLFFVGAISETLIEFLIGPQWHEAAMYLPLICISVSFYPLHALNLDMLQVLGRSDIFLYIEIAKKVISSITICIGIFYNIYAMLYASIVSNLICFFINAYYSGVKLGYSPLHQLKDVFPCYVIATIVAVTAYFLKYLGFDCIVVLLIQSVIGFVTTIVLCEVTNNNEYKELKSLVLKQYKKIKL